MANVLAHGTGALNIDATRIIAPGQHQPLGRWPANLIHDGSDEVLAGFPESFGGGFPKKVVRSVRGGEFCQRFTDEEREARINLGDAGSAARFFYCAKASKKDRGDGNHHPTVKPTDLMRYLCRLVTPPGGTVLDPFMGSGSTGKAAALEGFGFIGIDINPEYSAIACCRIEDAQRQGRLIA